LNRDQDMCFFHASSPFLPCSPCRQGAFSEKLMLLCPDFGNDTSATGILTENSADSPVNNRFTCYPASRYTPLLTGDLTKKRQLTNVPAHFNLENRNGR
jgi:hypothetical protein